MAAMSLGPSERALRRFDQRLAACVGKTNAITATGGRLVVLAYRMLPRRISDRGLSATEYDPQQRSWILRGLRKRAASLDFELVDTQTEPVP